MLRSSLRKTININPKSRETPICPLCKQAGRPKFQHFLSTCNFLPVEDRTCIASSKVRQSTNVLSDYDLDESDNEVHEPCQNQWQIKRVGTKRSPYLKAFFRHNPLILTLDSGA